MRLYNEILKKFDGGEAGELFAGTRYTVLPGRGGYFQGVKTVSEFSPCRIVVCFRHAVLEIEGSGFVIEKYCDGDLELSGQIVSVRLDGAKDWLFLPRNQKRRKGGTRKTCFLKK